MNEPMKWRNGVTVTRAASLEAQLHATDGTGRATVFDFAGTGGQRTWIGRVSLKPNACTGAHHHGRHEVMVYIISGRSEIRWGDGLRFVAEVGLGDFVYFSPYVPHQERNLSSEEAVEFLVARSDSEKIVVALDFVLVEHPALLA